jgi:hypothetical protein
MSVGKPIAPITADDTSLRLPHLNSVRPDRVRPFAGNGLISVDSCGVDSRASRLISVNCLAVSPT